MGISDWIWTSIWDFRLDGRIDSSSAAIGWCMLFEDDAVWVCSEFTLAVWLGHQSAWHLWYDDWLQHSQAVFVRRWTVSSLDRFPQCRGVRGSIWGIWIWIEFWYFSRIDWSAKRSSGSSSSLSLWCSSQWSKDLLGERTPFIYSSQIKYWDFWINTSRLLPSIDPVK